MSHTRPRTRFLEMAATNGQTLTVGVPRKIAFNTPATNTAAFTESTDAFTCTIPGLYLFHAPILHASGGTNAVNPYIYKNGAIEKVYSSDLNTLAQRNAIVSFFAHIQLAVGDVVEFYVLPQTTDLVVFSDSQIGIFRMELIS